MKEFNIKDFGARACDALQTEKIQAALDACFLAGGGKVIIPKGIFLTGGIRLRSNTTLYLESGAILRGSRSQFHFHLTPPSGSSPEKPGQFCHWGYGEASPCRPAYRASCSWEYSVSTPD